MNKITAEHLQRNACVYIRQSTPEALSEQCVGLAAIGAHSGVAIRREALPWSTANFSSGSMNW